jgi:hypothetical protein
MGIMGIYDHYTVGLLIVPCDAIAYTHLLFVPMLHKLVCFLYRNCCFSEDYTCHYHLTLLPKEFLEIWGCIMIMVKNIAVRSMVFELPIGIQTLSYNLYSIYLLAISLHEHFFSSSYLFFTWGTFSLVCHTQQDCTLKYL